MNQRQLKKLLRKKIILIGKAAENEHDYRELSIDFKDTAREHSCAHRGKSTLIKCGHPSRTSSLGCAWFMCPYGHAIISKEIN